MMRFHVRLLPVVVPVLAVFTSSQGNTCALAERGDVKKSPREIDLRVALVDASGMFLVYDAVSRSRSDLHSNADADRPAYQAYWADYRTGQLEVYGRRLFGRRDVQDNRI